jgi:hypothetical protein
MKKMLNSIPSASNDAKNSTKDEVIPSAHYIRNTVLVAGSFVALLLLQSCCWHDKEKVLKHNRQYFVGTTYDNNWSTSAMIDVDSFTMGSHKQMIIFVDGKKRTVFAPQFKIYSNEH